MGLVARALRDPALHERSIRIHSPDPNQLQAIDIARRSYGLLTSLAATLLWRALLDAILARAYAKAYGHGACYLRELRAIATDIGDYCEHTCGARGFHSWKQWSSSPSRASIRWAKSTRSTSSCT
jgi:hypothetical protein